METEDKNDGEKQCNIVGRNYFILHIFFLICFKSLKKFLVGKVLIVENL